LLLYLFSPRKAVTGDEVHDGTPIIGKAGGRVKIKGSSTVRDGLESGETPERQEENLSRRTSVPLFVQHS
jgi:hypothetical protein